MAAMFARDFQLFFIGNCLFLFRLLITAVNMAEEFSSHQILMILKTMQKMKCRNSRLLKK